VKRLHQQDDERSEIEQTWQQTKCEKSVGKAIVVEAEAAVACDEILRNCQPVPFRLVVQELSRTQCPGHSVVCARILSQSAERRESLTDQITSRTKRRH